MASRKVKEPRASKEQAAAWLSTVIAPMADALRVEREFVSRKRWSFRQGTRDFEYMMETDRMVAYPFVPNLVQLLKHERQLATLCRAHDSALHELRPACQGLFDRILQSVDFRRLTTEASPADVPYFAEYIVNGLRDLSYGMTHLEYWKHRGIDFINLRDGSDLREPARRVDSAGRNLDLAVKKLRTEIERLQQDLADEFLLPPVVDQLLIVEPRW
jgi:hypothetical protein